MSSSYRDTIFRVVSIIGIVEVELLPSLHIMYTITSAVHYVGAMCMCVCAGVHYKRICVQNFIACRPEPLMLSLLVQSSIERHSFVLMLVTSVVTLK